jgi:hypothetical protein
MADEKFMLLNLRTSNNCMKTLLSIVLLFTLTLTSYSQGRINRIGGLMGHSDPSPNQAAYQEQQRRIEQEKKYQAIDDNKAVVAALPPLAVKTPEQLIEMTNRLFAFRKEQADKNNSSTSQYNVGLMYINGQGTKTNRVLGIAYIKTASTNGNSDAVIYLKKNNL